QGRGAPADQPAVAVPRPDRLAASAAGRSTVMSHARTLTALAHRLRVRLAAPALGLLLTACAARLAEERQTGAPPELAAAQVRTIDLVQSPGRISPQRLTLPAGRYMFRVHNEDVPQAVSFHVSRMTADHGIGDEVPGSRLETPVAQGQAGTTAVVDL